MTTPAPAPAPSRRGRPPYDRLTDEYARWLFPYIDRLDWGYLDPGRGRPVRAATTARMNQSLARLTFPPRRLTRSQIQEHLDRTGKFYYTSRRASGFAFPMIDVDAHEGQTDAADAARFLVDVFFPGAYAEPSKRGYHIHPLLRVGRIRRAQFNDLLKRLEKDLGEIVSEQGFTSTVEVKGRFTLLEGHEVKVRGSLATIPALPGGDADLQRLRTAPVFLVRALEAVHEYAKQIEAVRTPIKEEPLPDVYGYKPTGTTPTRRDSPCAWERMQWACFDFTVVHLRLPTQEELLAYYGDTYNAHDENPQRRRRAADAINYRTRTFDPSKATQGGYERHRERLLEAVRTFCLDRTTNHPRPISDEDLAVTLYVVMLNSFQQRPDPRYQWTCPNACFAGMFRSLRAAGVIHRPTPNRQRLAGMKLILEKAELIDGKDRKWISFPGSGVGKKFTIGVNHWRYGEFVRFSQGMEVRYVGRTADGDDDARAAHAVRRAQAA